MKDIKGLPREECITQSKVLMCDFKIMKMQDTMKKRFSQKKDVETT